MALDPNDHIVVADENDSAFHSNSFATVANGNRVGVVSTETFEQRKQREKHRQIIQGYQTSNIGRPFAAATQSSPIAPTVSLTSSTTSAAQPVSQAPTNNKIV